MARNYVTRLRDTALQQEQVYRGWLTTLNLFRPVRTLPTMLENCVLQSEQEWRAATRALRRAGLVRHPHQPKNWDALIALSAILRRVPKHGCVLDAGAELYSPILPSLFLSGYRRLLGANLVFREPLRRGPITYVHADITATEFGNNAFDAVTCLSVVEHGVDVNTYFREMARILRPGGLLVTSTDYFPIPVDTKGQSAYGVPVRIFDRTEVMAAVKAAQHFGLQLTSDLQLDCITAPVRWERMGLDFTFLVLTMVKD